MFDPADKVSVELQAGEWNELLAATNPNAWQAIIEAVMQFGVTSCQHRRTR